MRTALEENTAGSPTVPGLFWTHRTTTDLVGELAAQGIRISWDVVKKLLTQFGFKVRRLIKSITMAPSRNRDAQFHKIDRLKRQFRRSGNPIFSVDSKRKESIGRMYRLGEVIANGEAAVLDHDLPSYAQAEAIPHGIYDISRNAAHLNFNSSHDTGEFACASLGWYWDHIASRHYESADSMLLLCDCGGSNGFKSSPFKYHLWRLACRLGVTIRVAHYPVHCSKYNPIERRVFPYVEQAFSGCVFDSLEMLASRAREARTATGLTTTAHVIAAQFLPAKRNKQPTPPTPVIHDPTLSEYNYKLPPRKLPDTN